MSFISLIEPPADRVDPAYWFAFQKNNLLVQVVDGKTIVPYVMSMEEIGFKPVRTQYLGLLDGRHCYSAELPLNAPWPESASFADLRRLHGIMDADFLKAAVNGVQVVNWDQTFQFCGRCGTPTENKTDERAKICPACGLVNFPRLSPAIMAAVIKDNQILLANGRGFPDHFFSVLAGFAEPGETLEECLAREVKEEVGLEVKNIHYFGSQPWPFPHSLMIAFSAEYLSGEICVDGEEIMKADWFAADSLPFRPDSRISISGQLIDWFENQYQ
ncbi:MAG: NAD(+) diphosphatase [bacterium]